MTVLNPTGKSKKERKVASVVFVLILLAFVIGAVATAKNGTFDAHYANEDMNSLFYAFQALSYGDGQGFVDGLFGALPIIGLFLVLFTLLFFLFNVVLGKLFGARKAVSTVLALVVTVYGFINPVIYNYMLSLNAFTIAFIVFSAVVIMIWGFTKRSYESYRREAEHWRREVLRKRENGEDPIEEYKRLQHALREMRKRHREERHAQGERHERDRIAQGRY